MITFLKKVLKDSVFGFKRFQEVSKVLLSLFSCNPPTFNCSLDYIWFKQSVWNGNFSSLVGVIEIQYSWVPNKRPPRVLIFRFFSTQNILISTPRLLIIGKRFQPRKTFWNYVLIFTSLRSRKRNGLVCIVFCFVSLCKEANILCFVL